MKTIEKYEEILKTEDANFSDYEVNQTLFLAYRNQKHTKNERIDLDYVIWDSDVEPISKELSAYGIDSFTVSSSFSSLIEILSAFEKQGFKIQGLVQVRTCYTDVITGVHRIKPAFLLERA